MESSDAFAVFGPRRSNQNTQAAFVLDEMVAQRARIKVLELAFWNCGERGRWGQVQQECRVVEQQIEIQKADSPGNELRQSDRQVHRYGGFTGATAW